MLNRDDPKSKEDVSSSVGGDDTSMVILSGDEANPSRIDKYVAPGTDESPRDADESEENASGIGEEEESSKKDEGEESREVNEGEKEKEAVDEGEKEKEVEEEKEPQRNDETALIVRPHGTESHAQSSILVAKTAEKELLETIGVDKESCWADDSNDAAVDSWSKILQKGSTQVFFEERFRIDCEARTAKLNGPTNPIGGPSNNAQSEVHADSVEDTGLEALKAMYGRLMKAVKDAVKDAVKELNKTVFSLSDKITLLEDEVKSLRSSGDNPSEENKESDEEDDVDKASEEEDGGDKETKESEEEDDVNNYIRDVTNEVQKEHGDVDANMDEDSAQMTADGSMGFGEEAAGKRNRDAKKAAEKKAAAKKEAAKKAAAEKEAAAAKKAAAEKKAAQKKPPLKPKKNKTKKVGKKTE
ncbi:hypothetical protein Bca101_067397 [Brassica carinata]